ncbi:hypothetical protein FB567DRAFT_545409 [Paraphoma chrysanthemicola]|uniref:C2H2-type domain-containing protein n=1 Tax=Paraphoma chrysanthemicola TaxID=798071 RepID=A0A8K0RGA6_9PLEO|nr:hypothetical protein FB567DRAFT_545409 [Paraphoma chrysanthemicola]
MACNISPPGLSGPPGSTNTALSFVTSALLAFNNCDGIVLTLTPVFSDSFFDSPPEPVSCISSIAEWRKDIPTQTVTGEDFPFSADFQDMTSSDLFELQDTISECSSSMDSAYQSQSGASRRGHRKPEGYNAQDNRPRVGPQFVGSEIYSPSMSSENYNAFADQTLDMSHLQQPSGTWDTPEESIVYANYSAGQDFSQYATTNAPRYTPTTSVGMSPWVSTDAQFHNNQFTFSYPAGQSPAEMMFSANAPSQRPWNNSQFDGQDRPSAVRSSSSYTLPQDSRRTSAHDTTFGAFVATPTSTSSVHFPQTVEFDQTRLMEPRNDNEDAHSTSVPPQSLEETDDIVSQADAAETKLEEERTKVARSHPLYATLPDKDGKYHCPEEGKPGCSHKPTPLKCNYDKYVDSHLKPFRCNKKTCVGVQFSSTACLLRHEREAHGMHGHGARPHLCHFRDCERAVPGHGFPRRYNLFDHMKRVHQYDGPTTEPSPPAMPGQAQRKTLNRKRKASTEDANEKRQKAAKITAEQLRQQARDQLAHQFAMKKQHIIDILTNLTNPNDLQDDIQLTKEVVGLHEICTKFRANYGG